MQNVIENNIFKNGCVASTGFFDGVHRGHHAVLQALKSAGQRLGLPSCVITFWPHPRIVLNKDPQNLRLLSSLEEKEELVRRAGIDHFIVLPFTLNFSKQTAEEFISDTLAGQLNTKYMVVGYDHHLGSGGQTDYAQIERICEAVGIATERVEADQWKGITVSSSKVRHALEQGDLPLANDLLGYTYSLTGTVVHGQKLGRKLGFPTANILPMEHLKLVPPKGVYSVHATVRGVSFEGMLYIGSRPTVNNSQQIVVEVHLFNYTGDDLYGETATVYFEHYLRGDIKFPNAEELRLQIALDQENTLQWLRNNA